MVCLLPTLADFLQNRFEVRVQDLVLPVALDLLLAVVIVAALRRLYRRHQLAGLVAGCLTAAVVSNGFESRLQASYSLISALMPIPGLAGSLQGFVFSIVFFGLAAGLAALAASWLGRLVRRRNWSEAEFARAVVIAITVVFLLVLAPVGRALAVAWPQFFYRPPSLTIGQAEAKPDIYYIVLDRYASQSVLKDQFNFDNSDFIQYLEANGYVTNPESHNNYPYTTMSIASTLSANYLSDVISKFNTSSQQTVAPYHATVRSSPVIQALKSKGYTYNLVGNWYETSNQSPLADHTYQEEGRLTIFGHTVTLDNFSKNELNDGAFARLSQLRLHVGGFGLFQYSGQVGADQSLYQLKILKQLAAQPSTGGHFTFAHILVPHDPYYFNADGSLATTPGNDNNGQPIKQKYVGQVKFINDQIKTILDQINQTSHGQAVVVLQADEGPYPIQLNNQNFDQDSADSEINGVDMRTWSDLDLKMKFGNLAAYHVPAASAEDLAKADDPVNIFRLVLNSYFSGQYPYLPLCSYAYPNGRAKPFVYADITQRLTGQPSPGCGGG